MDSKSAWCGKKDDKTPWYQMDLGEVKEVAGVVVASRSVLSVKVEIRFFYRINLNQLHNIESI